VEAQPATAPRKPRLEGLDVARAFAILGMVLVNYKIAMTAEEGSQWLISLVSLLEGRAAALFVVLAGVGVSLMFRRALATQDPLLMSQKRKELFKRALLLIAVGLAYSPIWPADILHFYGFYMLVALIVIQLANRWLWWFSVALLLEFVVLLLVFDYETGWDFTTLEYLDFWQWQGMIRHIFFNGFHPVAPWAAFLIMGLWLGRQDLTSQGFRNKLLVMSISVVVVIEGLSLLAVRWSLSAFPEVPADELVALLGTKPMPPMPQYIISGTASAFAMIALMLTLVERAGDWIKPLVYTGQLSLTLYVAHVLIGMGTLEAVGRLYNQSIDFSVLSALVFFICGLFFAWGWRLKFSQGPLEWVFRKIARG